MRKESDSHSLVSAKPEITFSFAARKHWCSIASLLGTLWIGRFFTGSPFLQFIVLDSPAILSLTAFCGGQIAAVRLAALKRPVVSGLLHLRPCSPFRKLPSQCSHPEHRSLQLWSPQHLMEV